MLLASITLLLGLIDSVASHTHSVDKGYFWQITDFHYDANYTLHGDPSKMCHDSSSSATGYNLGKFGNYRCDSPWDLVKSSIYAMKSIKANTDFILWTGDSVPHVDDSTYNEAKVFTIIRNVTEMLLSEFPYTRILPSFGNHDPYPANEMPYEDPNYYASILNTSQWVKLIPSDAHDTFIKGGYFSYSVSSKLKVISLNTAIYFSMNNLTRLSNDNDPGGQFAWLTSELEKSKLNKQKVYIAAHVPPGTYELMPMFRWFHDAFNIKYLDIISSYSNVITAQFYGHEHTDSLRIFDTTESVGDYSAMFLSPSVTPYKGAKPTDHSNPSIRLYTYDRSTSQVLDYHQYYLNLSTANQGGSAAQWELEYQFTTAYDVENLNPQSVKSVVDKIFNSDKHHEKYLERYLRYNLISSTNEECNQTCLLNHICSVRYLRNIKLDYCLSNDHHNHHTSTANLHHHHHKTAGNVSRCVTQTVLLLTLVLMILTGALMMFYFRSQWFVSFRRVNGKVARHELI